MEAYLDTTKSLDTLIVGAGFAGMYSLHKQLSDGYKAEIYEQANERWEYAVSLTPNDEFVQVSFVNGIFTSKGGKHVEYILNHDISNLKS